MRKLPILALFATFSCNPAFAQFYDNGAERYQDQQARIEQDYQNQQMQDQQQQLQQQLELQQEEIDSHQTQYPVFSGGGVEQR